MRNEEPQTVIRDLHWSRSVHFYTEKCSLIKKKRSEKYSASKNGVTDGFFKWNQSEGLTSVCFFKAKNLNEKPLYN